MEEENSKFTESEMVVGGLFALGIDGICALTDLTGVGLAITPVIQGFAVFAISQWAESKGGAPASLGKQLAKYAAQFLPVLPTVLAVFVIEVAVHNNPALKEVAEKVAKTAPAVK